MKFLYKTFIFILIAVAFQCAKAQIGVGEWRGHLSFNFSIAISESPDKIYVASKNGIFSYSKSSNNIEKLTKVNLLSDIGISSIAYSSNHNLLLVGYSNGNIDIISDNNIFNIPDIKREIITGSKSINNILFVENDAYLSCGFGIVIVSLEKKEIKDTYYIGDLGTQINVNQLILENNYFYAATDQGIFIADYSNPNLIDYSNWQVITDIPGYNSSFNSIYVNDGRILVNQHHESLNDIVYVYENGLWNNFNNEYASIRKIKNTNSTIQLVTDRNVLIYDSDFNFLDSIAGNLNPYDVIMGDNISWIADKGNGLVKYQNETFEMISPNGPYTENAFAIDADKERVLVAAGGLSPSWGNVYLNATIFSFQKEHWSSFINYNAPDYVSVKIDPYNTNHYYACSWGNGLVEYENDEIIETFDESNSTIQSVISQENLYRVSGLVFDEAHNLWVTNSLTTNPILVKKDNGDWLSFSFEESIRNILVGDIIVTQNNNKWVILPTGNGLFVFNSGESLDDKNDDVFKKLNIIDENGKIITNHVYSIAEDLDGDIWVGTNQGIVVYYSPENIFEEEGIFARRIIVTIGEITDYLLKNQIITSICIDGANRKWIGTLNSGVYLVSEDGTEELYHFTESNSPLLSDRINDIGINHESGEVFFATEKGLISYKGSATMGSDEFRDVYVYPNPVRENYQGDITIRGLVSDVNVKITDIGGNIVYETTAQGGQATWDGKNFSGRRVSTGVYLVFCSNEDGSKTHITKLLFIK